MDLGGTTIHGTTKHNSTVSVVVKGTYNGDGTQNRGIPHGLGQIPKWVQIYEETTGVMGSLYYDSTILAWPAAGAAAVTAMDATNFYVGSAANFYGNVNARKHNWVAMV